MKLSDNLTVFDLPFNGVIVNGEELSGDVNANTDTEGCQVVELVFTELQAVESESVEETKRSPKKKYKQRWENNCVGVDTMDTDEVVESGLDIVISDDVLSGELDSMVARLIALTEELDVVKARNTDLEETVITVNCTQKWRLRM